MEEISAFQAFLGTYQSLADWIKALWLIVPPVFIFAMTALILRGRREVPEVDGELVYTVHRDDGGQYRVLRHAPPGDAPALLPLDRTQPALTSPERHSARE
ncbi:hypothetical protein [Saliniramus sp.]|uniref:hypothetical protein n=1 Tax=Saliniramus sp. TaxID=2986772 RepID=UPI002C0B2B98|nr:hypothetical protein [Saliniramus sp.]HMB11611.1 hypothetical protein [Saliniramus sp.]